MAKTSQSPVVLISTSGTAPANFYPAVIETSLSCVPLIILSADRPNFLIGTGENQTINQQNLYGSHVRYFADVGLPSKQVDELEKIIKNAVQDVKGSKLKLPPGPVHLNFPFDEPLLPEKGDETDIPSPIPSAIPKFKLNLQFPILKEAKRPLIIAGPMEGNIHQKEIIELGKKIHAPILADPLSQLRYGFESELIFSHYDIFLRYMQLQPDQVIRFGRKPTSKILCKLLSEWKENTILVDAFQQFNDDCPNFIQSHIGEYCIKQAEEISWKNSRDWFRQLLSFENIIKNEIQINNEYHEGNIAKTCFKSIGEGGCFIIGNSMPIRDVDIFTSTSEKLIHVFSNRGASGIDGVISTALGICEGKRNAHSLLLIGDLSFYHDMNGLLASKYGINLTVVVINNSGGGIFSFLPISDAGLKKYDQFWTTDTGLNIEKVSELYNLRYYLSEDLKELENNIENSFNVSGVKIVEIKTVISDNISAHRNFMERAERLILDH